MSIDKQRVWTWADEQAFMRRMGDRLDNYVALSLELRVRDFEGFPVTPRFRERFRKCAERAKEQIELLGSEG